MLQWTGYGEAGAGFRLKPDADSDLGRFGKAPVGLAQPPGPTTHAGLPVDQLMKLED
jgi:hypothetical protein